MKLKIADKLFSSRLLLGTALYPSLEIMHQAVQASECDIITVSIRRQMPNQNQSTEFWNYLISLNKHILPNTAGCRSAKEAITTAQMAREIFNTNWIKLEVIGDDYTLQPDPFELLIAARELSQQGFIVLPYCTDDLILCERLLQAGCAALMPWASPIGSGQGLLNPYNLKILRQRFNETILIVDAGIGAPAHATAAMELGFDAILLNSAVALATDPVKMGLAFAKAIEAGRLGYEAGIMPPRDMAHPSTPVLGTPFHNLNEKESNHE